MCLQQNGYSSHSHFRCISFDHDVVLGNKKDLICLTNQLLIHSCCVFIYFSVVKLDAWIMSLIIFFFLISAKNTQAETTNPSSNSPNCPTTCFNRKGSSLSSVSWALAKSSLLKWNQVYCFDLLYEVRLQRVLLWWAAYKGNQIYLNNCLANHYKILCTLWWHQFHGKCLCCMSLTLKLPWFRGWILAAKQHSFWLS